MVDHQRGDHQRADTARRALPWKRLTPWLAAACYTTPTAMYHAFHSVYLRRDFTAPRDAR